MATKFLKQYEILLKKAKVDLHTAKLLLTSFDNGDTELELEVIFFHFQQCAEKLIKTILDFNQIKFPHNHNIRELIKLTNDNNIIIKYIDELSQLTQYAVEGRYAILHDDLDDTDKYIVILDELLEFVKDGIK
ncbi:MAG: HEPN domain-containing protein [Campylobacterota bacterium]|nr:HEPN domain-containing protein [Campylobacterota bacterium]